MPPKRKRTTKKFTGPMTKKARPQTMVNTMKKMVVETIARNIEVKCSVHTSADSLEIGRNIFIILDGSMI
jgi:hypothetical protein